MHSKLRLNKAPRIQPRLQAPPFMFSIRLIKPPMHITSPWTLTYKSIQACVRRQNLTHKFWRDTHMRCMADGPVKAATFWARCASHLYSPFISFFIRRASRRSSFTAACKGRTLMLTVYQLHYAQKRRKRKGRRRRQSEEQAQQRDIRLSAIYIEQCDSTINNIDIQP